MRKKILRAFAAITFATLSASGQQVQPSAPPAAPAPSQGTQTLPPGLERRQQLPPGLNQRQMLPPGLAGRADADAANNGLADTNGQPGTVGTNYLGRFGTNWSRFQTNVARFGTNAFQNLTNAWTSLSNRFGGTNGGLLPTGNGTNRMYSTNSYSSTNGFGANIRDQVYTAADQRLLLQIRQLTQPVFVGANYNQYSMPVHFVIREGVVTMVGSIPDQERKQRLAALVREVPGVVQVVDQLQVNAQGETQLGTVPSSASAQVAATDQASSASDQQLIVRLQQQVQPIIGNSGPWSPVHFLSREGVVTLTGFVPNEQEKQQIFQVVQSTPGVVQVVNQLQVNVNAQAAPGAVGGGSNAVLQAGPAQATNYFGGTFGRTNFYYGNTNLSATGRSNAAARVYPDTNLPPGLRKREDLPPGLQRQDDLPPGLEKRQGTSQ